METIAKDDMEVLSQLIDDEQGIYRIRAKSRVHYLTTSSGAFKDHTMNRPYLLIPQLPEFPDWDWTKMSVTRDTETQELRTTLPSEPLSQIPNLWHPICGDVLSLVPIRRF